MKVTNNDEKLASQVKRLNDKQRQLANLKEQEIRNLQEFYNKRADTVKLEGQKQVWQAKDEGEQKLLETIATEEERLQKHRSLLQDTKTNLEQEKEQLQQNFRKNIMDLNDNLKHKAESTFAEAQQYAKEADDQNRQFIKDLDYNTNRQQTLLRSKAQSKIDRQSRASELKIKDSEDQYNNLIKIKNYEQERALNVQEVNHKNQLKELYKNHEVENLQQKQINKDLLDQNKSHYTMLLQQQRETFMKRFAKQKEDYDAVMKQTQDRFERELHQLIASSTADKKNITEKRNDSFYKLEKLDPQVKDIGDSYLISINCPEHERENFHLSAYQRDLTMTMTRNFANDLEVDAGNSYHSKRSEILSRKFTVPDILNGKKVTQKHENGVLTFKIAKL